MRLWLWYINCVKPRKCEVLSQLYNIPITLLINTILNQDWTHHRNTSLFTFCLLHHLYLQETWSYLKRARRMMSNCCFSLFAFTQVNCFIAYVKLFWAEKPCRNPPVFTTLQTPDIFALISNMQEWFIAQVCVKHVCYLPVNANKSVSMFWKAEHQYQENGHIFRVKGKLAAEL